VTTAEFPRGADQMCVGAGSPVALRHLRRKGTLV